MAEGYSPQSVRRSCEMLFAQCGIPFEPLWHQPVLDYDTAAAVRKQFGLHGSETKSLFLGARKSRYYMLVSLENSRINWADVKRLTGERLSLASREVLLKETGCQPDCAVPLGLPSHVTLIIDTVIEQQSAVIFSPGPPEETIQITGDQWANLLNKVENRVILYTY